MYESANYFTSSPTSISHLHFSHLSGCEVVTHCELNLHFPKTMMLNIFSCAYLASVYLLCLFTYPFIFNWIVDALSIESWEYITPYVLWIFFLVRLVRCDHSSAYRRHLCPQHWSRTLLCSLSIVFEAWGFPAWLVWTGIIPGPVWKPAMVTSSSLSQFFPWPWGISLGTCADQLLAGNSRGALSRSLEFPFCVLFSSLVLCPENSSCFDLNSGSLLGTCYLPPPTLQYCWKLKIANRDKLGVHLICSCLLGITVLCFWCLVLQKQFRHVFLSLFLLLLQMGG